MSTLFCTLVILMTMSTLASGANTTSKNVTATLTCLNQTNSTTLPNIPGSDKALFVCYHVYMSPLLVNNPMPYIAVFKGCFAIGPLVSCQPETWCDSLMSKKTNFNTVCCFTPTKDNCTKDYFYKKYYAKEPVPRTTDIVRHNTFTRQDKKTSIATLLKIKTTTGPTRVGDRAKPNHDCFCAVYWNILVLVVILLIAVALHELVRWKLNKYYIYNVSVRYTRRKGEEKPCSTCATESKEKENIYEETNI